MHIALVTPAPVGLIGGNLVTANRWATILEGLGHEVRQEREWTDTAADILVALHARKSARSIQRFVSKHPDRPVVVALTGTDVYGDQASSAELHAILRHAARIVVLQPAAREMLPEDLRDRVRVIYQSIEAPFDVCQKRQDRFDVCFIANLREVKDPLCICEAVRHLPVSSRIHVTHIGAAINDDWRERARQATSSTARYEWIGPLSRDETMRMLAASHLSAITSKAEGGANAVSESIVCGVPVISSRIQGSIGMLGEDYPGYFSVGDSNDLAALLLRAETDTEFYKALFERAMTKRPLFHPNLERLAWKGLLQEIP